MAMPSILQKKSYSISADSVSFLEQLRQEREGKSVSQILDEVLQEARRVYQLKRLEEQTAYYYDQLSSEERKEQQLWGELGLANFPDERG